MQKTDSKIEYPMRLNRYLALNGYCTRREADGLIESGQVTVNDKIAKVGMKVVETDEIKVSKKAKNLSKQYVYFAYNKPRGIVTHSPEENQKSIQQVAKVPKDVFPVGRLDRDSHGLILLTNDGRITDKLLNPNNEHEKEYSVRVNKPITNIFLKVLARGVQLEDYKTKPCTTEKVDDFTFKIILKEGKKHQIRRMCAAFGFAVSDLRRNRIMSVRLKGLKVGQARRLQGEELKKILASLKLA
jgi:23S rRNA pseudouridine2604 synthase